VSTPFYLSYAALWLLIIAHSLLLLGVVRLVYQLQQEGIHGPRPVPGREAPTFSSVDLAGVPIRSEDFAGRLRALLFISPSCPSCSTTVTELQALSYKAQGSVIVICRGGRDACQQLVASQDLNVPVVADEDQRISQLFDISAVPMAIIIDEQNLIQSYGQPKRGEELQAMLAQAPISQAAGVA